MISTIYPEPICDLRAQLEALANGAKHCVYIAPGSAYVVIRAEGTLVTKDVRIAEFFRTKSEITDDDMAQILGYPEPKSRVVDPVVVQERDAGGSVINEYAISRHLLTPEEAIQRRMERAA
jgi:hypothetical protein